VWKREVDGRALTFRLAGINNQNFLMRDEETGTWWQQVSGKALFGPLKGRVLEPVVSDELTFAQWKQESPDGQVLAPSQKYQGKYEDNWEPEVAKLPTVIDFPGTGLKARDVIMGIERNGVSRAYPFDAALAQSPIQDRVGGDPIVLLVGPDKKSVRAFHSRIEGSDVELFRSGEQLVDSSGNSWDFKGCATAGPLQGKCLEQIAILKDYWFDWRNYHHDTSIYRH
jgi:Protein of unknown function (DUF3179)